MKDSLILLVQILLKKNKISFDKEELAFQIQSHPSYPSLHAITGVLDHFNIENVAADVPVNLETIVQLPDCFIAQVNIKDTPSLVVVERKKEAYTIFNTDNKKERVLEEEFLRRFTGVIVAVDKPEEDQVGINSSKRVRYVAFGVLAILTAIILFKTSTSIYNIFYLVLSLIGVVISFSISKQELGLQTSIGDAFCSGAGDKKDCDAVLTSKGAEIIKGYKLSDFSLLYFSALTVITFIQIKNPALSFSISLLAIPVTIYSVYYQYAVIKKWCMLCLSIVGLLWLQALIPIILKNYISEFVFNDSIVFGFVMISSWLVWSYVKPIIVEVTALRKDKIEGVKFKRNFTLFEGMLNKAPKLNTNIVESEEIIFGNLHSKLEIVVVTNPFCGHCKPVHQQIDEILHKYKDKVKIVIRFNVNLKEVNSDSVRVTSRLVNIYKEKGKEECLLAMSEIYEKGNAKDWLSKWGESSNINFSNKELERENIWCRDNSINFTPEILINGQSFPKEYNRSDLIFFIEELEESANQILIPIKEIQTM